MEWHVVLVERLIDGRRLIDHPNAHEVRQAQLGWDPSNVDLGVIPEGKETRVLLRHGFSEWTDLYPSRQLVVTDGILKAIEDDVHAQRSQSALRLAVVGTGEMAGHASRWDRWYLKSYELMARHRFSITTLAVEPNVWGVDGHGRGTVQNRVRSFIRATRWLREKKVTDGVDTRSLSHGRSKSGFGRYDAVIVHGSSKRMLLPSGRIDLILTDPPYHDDIQYTELSALFRAWGGLPTRPTPGSVVVHGPGANVIYEDLLYGVFQECHRIMRPGGHMIMSFANRESSAWESLIGALDRCGFVGCGVAVVHGENESDYAKQNGRHYTHNLLIDVVKSSFVNRGSWLPEIDTTGELGFLREVGEVILTLGSLAPDWRDQLGRAVGDHSFG